jgi:hypothetical protein
VVWCVEAIFAGEARELEVSARLVHDMINRLAETARADALLLAMPAITVRNDGEGGYELVMRWVGVHADGAADAVVQVSSILSRLDAVLRLSAHSNLVVRASPEAT